MFVLMLTAEDEDHVFKALAHRDRRALLRIIGNDERSVGALAETTALEQPIVSQHLKVLRTAGLVSVRAEGNRRLYSVDARQIGVVREFLDHFWSDKLDALKIVAER